MSKDYEKSELSPEIVCSTSSPLLHDLIFLPTRSRDQPLHVVREQIADTIQADVCRWKRRKDSWFGRVMSLARKHSRHPEPPGLLDGRQDAELIVHQHIMIGGIAALEIVELRLFFEKYKNHLD